MEEKANRNLNVTSDVSSVSHLNTSSLDLIVALAVRLVIVNSVFHLLSPFCL